MKGATFISTLQRLGVIPSYSRPRCSDDNPYSESLFKTLKYNVGYPKSFKSIEDAKEWVADFVNWYNTEHRHSAIQWVTPVQRHTGEDIKILESRRHTYEEAKRKNPSRWIKNKIRSWQYIEYVYLNPKKDTEMLPVYFAQTDGEISSYIIPISGKGLWSTIYGYLALEPNVSTVKGITFYQHGETPGLGGEIEKDYYWYAEKARIPYPKSYKYKAHKNGISFEEDIDEPMIAESENDWDRLRWLSPMSLKHHRNLSLESEPLP